MAKHTAARADLESLLRVRQLDRTLTTALPSRELADEYASGSTGVADLDARLGGGLPRGHVSEIAGPRSSGRTSLLLAIAAAATRRGERVALVDALDMLDVASAQAAGVDLDRLLWVRGQVAMHPGGCRDANVRAITQAVRACTLALSSGVFGLVIFDVAEAPRVLVRGLPFTTWLRLHRLIEGGQTIGLLVGSQPLARSAGGVVLQLGQSACGHAESRSGGMIAAWAKAGSEQRQPEAERDRARPRDLIAAWGASGGGAPRAVKMKIVRARNSDERALTIRVETHAEV